MIGYFPELYPDELVYSALARYHAGNGYLGYICSAEDLFKSPWNVPDIEFINNLTDSAVAELTRNDSIENIILNHTMFPLYGRFLKQDRRNNAFSSLVKMSGNHYKMVAVPKKKTNCIKMLKYCPRCIVQDAQKYGETYWHRSHQMTGVNVCPIHGCYLYDSSVEIKSRKSPSLEIAADHATNTEIIMCDNEIVRKVAKYTADVMKSKIDFENNIDVSEYLHSRIAGTKYTSNRGVQRNISLLFEDFNKELESVPWNTIDELWKLQKIFTGDRRLFTEVCLVAFFLAVPVDDLANMKLPELKPGEEFDRKIFALRDQGLNYREISKKLNASYDVCKAIGEKRYQISNKGRTTNKGGLKRGDWNEKDRAALPKVIEAVKETYNAPKRVTPTGIQRMIGLPEKSITKMPLCMDVIEKYAESQGEWWARKTVFAAKKIIESGNPLTSTRIYRLTNIKRKDKDKFIGYIKKYADAELTEMIKEIL